MDIGQIRSYFDYSFKRLFQSFCSTGQFTPVDEFTGIVMNGKVYTVVKSLDNHYQYIDENGRMVDLPKDDSLYQWKNISGRHIKEYIRWYNTNKGAVSIGYTDVVTNMQDLYSRKMRVLDSENPDYGIGLEVEAIPDNWTELRSYYFLHKDLRTIMDKIDITNATLDEMKKADAAFYESAKESYADMQDKLGKINENTDEVEDKLDKIDTNTDEVEIKLDKIDQNTDGVESSLAGIETSVDNIDKNTDEIEVKLDKIDQNTDDVEAKLDKIDQNTDEIEVKLDKIDQNTDEVETTLSGIKEDTSAINTNTDEVETSLSGIKSDTEAIKSNTDEVEASLAGIKSDTETIKSNTDEVEASLAGIKSDTEIINANTDEIEGKLTNIENNTAKDPDPSPEG